MNINKKNFFNGVAFISFILLFPGFFFYHFLAARSYIPPFLGGYFSAIAFFLFPVLIFSGWRSGINTAYKTDILFILMMLLTLLNAILNYIYVPLFGWESEIFVWSLLGVLFNMVAYIIGVGLNISLRHVMVIALALSLMVVIVFLNIGDAGIFYVKQEAEDNFEKIATYQGFGRSLVVVSLIATAYFFRSSRFFFVVVLLAVGGLFFNGARTEFVIYLTTVLLVMFVYIVRSIKAFFGVGIFVIISLIAYFFVIDLLPESRMFQLADVASSSSAEARMDLLQFGMELIYKNPFLGGYGQYVQLGGIGLYPHNIISAWVNLGLLGFVMYLCIFLLMWREAIAKRIVHQNILEFKIFLFFLFYVSMSLLISKDYSYMLVGFVLGLFANYKNKIRRVSNNKS